MNQADILEKVIRLHTLYRKGKIKTLAEHEVHPTLDLSSRENYLYFTLPVCINFQRNSPALWRSALKTWDDGETRSVFFPEKVFEMEVSHLGFSLAKYGLALQRNKHTSIWMRICETLHHHFDDDPRKVLHMGRSDSARILKLLQEEKREWFPYLGGTKLAPYWLFILSLYTDARLDSMGSLSIIPDTHVIQSSVKLGLVDPGTPSKVVALAWQKLLEGTSINPVGMHPVLWNWSRNGFMPEV